jgi:hypothetical protein
MCSLNRICKPFNIDSPAYYQFKDRNMSSTPNANQSILEESNVSTQTIKAKVVPVQDITPLIGQIQGQIPVFSPGIGTTTDRPVFVEDTEDQIVQNFATGSNSIADSSGNLPEQSSSKQKNVKRSSSTDAHVTSQHLSESDHATNTLQNLAGSADQSTNDDDWLMRSLFHRRKRGYDVYQLDSETEDSYVLPLPSERIVRQDMSVPSPAQYRFLSSLLEDDFPTLPNTSDPRLPLLPTLTDGPTPHTLQQQSPFSENQDPLALDRARWATADETELAHRVRAQFVAALALGDQNYIARKMRKLQNSGSIEYDAWRLRLLTRVYTHVLGDQDVGKDGYWIWYRKDHGI